MIIIQILIAITIGYVIGTSNMAFYLSKLKKIDIRNTGSKNLGASNAAIVLGKGLGAITLLHDILKPYFASFVVKIIFPECNYLHIIAATSTVFGHIFPFWLKFKGGKGFAAYVGTLLVLDWRFFLIAFVGALLITIISDYIIYGTIAVTTIAPFFALYHSGVIACIALTIASICIIWKHKENFERMKNGTEIGFKSAASGKYKKK